MPLDNLVKIRLTLSDLNQLTQLQQEIRVGEHLDANFILSKMFVDNAFQFCLFAKEVSCVKITKKLLVYNCINNCYFIQTEIVRFR